MSKPLPVDEAHPPEAERHAAFLAGLFPQIWEAAADAMAVSDARGTVLAANPAYLQLYGYTAEQVVGQNFAIIFPEEQRSWANEAYQTTFHAAENAGGSGVETTIQRGDGTLRVVESRFTFLVEAGARIAMLSTIRDITERKRLEATAALAHAEAQEAIALRDTFLSVAAHELKSPLTAMLGNVQLLQRRAARGILEPEKEQQVLGLLVGQIRRMTRLLNELLDVSRIELGQLSLTLHPLDVVTLVLELVDELQSSHQQHLLTVEVPETALVVDGDELRLQQSLQNLLQNATKYTPVGRPISVRVAKVDGTVRIEIEDEGIGIPSSELPHLFQRFYRAENARAQQIPGVGIGLYVVKEIVGLHGGRIEVESVEGQGSRFAIWLPLARD